MATRAKFVRLAQYWHKFSEASHIFFKNIIWQMASSLASPLKMVWQMSASLASPSKTDWRMLAILASLSYFWKGTFWRMQLLAKFSKIAKFAKLWNDCYFVLCTLDNRMYIVVVSSNQIWHLCFINCNEFVVVSSNQISHLCPINCNQYIVVSSNQITHLCSINCNQVVVVSSNQIRHLFPISCNQFVVVFSNLLWHLCAISCNQKQIWGVLAKLLRECLWVWRVLVLVVVEYGRVWQISKISEKYHFSKCEYSPKTASFGRVLKFAKFAREWPLLNHNLSTDCKHKKS